MIKIGSRWIGNEGNVFIVISNAEVDGNRWVHYRNDQTGQEYSCFEESFVSRFRENANHAYQPKLS